MESSDCDDVGDVMKWFVIETKAEYCLVEEPQVLCEPSVAVGETVAFLWTKQKKYEGIVRFIHCNVDACEDEMKRLVAVQKQGKKRDTSFHDDRPRKAAMKYKESLKNPVSRKKSAKLAKPDSAMKKVSYSELLQERDMEIPKKKKKKICDSDDSDSDKAGTSLPKLTSFSKTVDKLALQVLDEDSDVSTIPVSPNSSVEEDSTDDLQPDDSKKAMKLAAMLASKFDVETLTKLSEGINPFSTPKTTASKQEESTTSTLNATPNATSSIHTDEGKPARSTESVTSPGNQGRSSPANKSERTTPLHHVHGVHNGFAGKMFLCDSDTPDAVEVFPASKIYCSATQFDRAELANSATMYARRVLEGVYTQEALLKCSVSGLPPRGKGKDSYKDGGIKPFLDPKGVNAIVSQATAVQKKRHFIKKKDDAQIRQAMAVRMNEIQQKEKK